MKSKQMPFAYSFNVETPNQLINIITEEGKVLFIVVININYNQ
jgi:hypothetical protein